MSDHISTSDALFAAVTAYAAELQADEFTEGVALGVLVEWLCVRDVALATEAMTMFLLFARRTKALNDLHEEQWERLYQDREERSR